MKRRLNFVSNSSSSSFVALITNKTDKPVLVEDAIKANFKQFITDVTGLHSFRDIAEIFCLRDKLESKKYNMDDIDLEDEYEVLKYIQQLIPIKMTKKIMIPNEQVMLYSSHFCTEDYSDSVYVHCINVEPAQNGCVAFSSKSIYS